MRTFIAIDLSVEIKNQLSHLVNFLKPPARDIKWVARENYHLTLNFLGEIDDRQVDIIRTVLDEVVKRHNQFVLTMKGAGSFPRGQSRMRVIWVGVAEESELLSLQQDVEESLFRKNFRREERPFSPHLTIGRAKVPENQERLRKELEKYSQKEFGSMLVKEITFFQSILRPEGPEYKIISQHNLS
jgi:2'-5' RNA ligase